MPKKYIYRRDEDEEICEPCFQNEIDVTDLTEDDFIPIDDSLPFVCTTCGETIK